MKITYISAQTVGDDDSTSVTASVAMGSMSHMNALQLVAEKLGEIDGFEIPPSLRREAPAEEAPAEEKPAPRRRGRPKKEVAESDNSEAPAAEEAAPAEAPKRRGRPKKEPEAAAAEETAPEGGEEISDIQLAKAASKAAKAIGPEGVTAVLSEFEVEKVNDLPQEERETFLTTLDIMVDQAS